MLQDNYDIWLYPSFGWEDLKRLLLILSVRSLHVVKGDAKSTLNIPQPRYWICSTQSLWEKLLRENTSHRELLLHLENLWYWFVNFKSWVPGIAWWKILTDLRNQLYDAVGCTLHRSGQNCDGKYWQNMDEYRGENCMMENIDRSQEPVVWCGWLYTP